MVVDDHVARLVLTDGTSIVCGEAEPGPSVGGLFPEDVVLFRRLPEAGSTSLRNVREGTVVSIEALGRLRRVTVVSGAVTLVAARARATPDDLAESRAAGVAAAVPDGATTGAGDTGLVGRFAGWLAGLFGL